MTKAAILRRKHRRDFEARRPHAPVLKFRNTEYIPVHPFADDRATLESIGLAPEKCTVVDAYWKVYGDVILLQVNTTANDSVHRPGRYARWNRLHGRVNLCLVVDVPAISRARFEAELATLMDRGAAGRAVSRARYLSDALVPI